MKTDWIRKGIGLILLVSLFALPWLTPFQIYLSIPNQIKTFEGLHDISLPTLGNSIELQAENEQTVQHATDIIPFSFAESGEQEVVYTFSDIPVKKRWISLFMRISV